MIGIALLTWSSLRVFRGLNVAISSIYGEGDAAPFSRQVVEALLVLIVLPVALAAAAVLGVLIRHWGAKRSPLSSRRGPSCSP
ncbi:MAG: hypothetical protein ABEJ55_02795 [Halanaeroarchaeum sp.]